MPFNRLGLPSSLVRNVLALGYSSPTPIQTQAIPVARSGRDLVGTAQTGTGKTAAFLLPVLEQLLGQTPRDLGALVLTPTRELAQQIQNVFRGLAANTPLRAALVVGGAPMTPQVQALRRGVDLVVATPGRLLALLRDGLASMPAVRTLVLDEADMMFDLGFLPDVKRIIGRLPARRQTLVFSATMPPEIARLAKTLLRDPVNVAIGAEGTAASGIRQTAYPVPASRKTALLENLLEQMENPSVLVFTRTRRGAKRLTRTLYESGHEVGQLHADCSPSQRERAMQGFRARAFPILVATNIAARGLDVRHVTHVISYDVPDTSEEYVHRIGRTGRAGDQGDALVLVAPEEAALLARIERRLGKPISRRHLPHFDYGASREKAHAHGKPVLATARQKPGASFKTRSKRRR